MTDPRSETANRFLVFAYMPNTRRWTFDSTHLLGLAQEWAQDMLQHPDRYQAITLRDVALGLDLPLHSPRTYQSDAERAGS